MLRRAAILVATISWVLLNAVLIKGAVPASADTPTGSITPGSGPLTAPFSVLFSGFDPNTPLTLSGSFNGGVSWFNVSTAFTPSGLATDSQGNAKATIDANTLRILHDVAAQVPNSPSMPSPGAVIYFGSTPPIGGPEQYRMLKTGELAACDDSSCAYWTYTVIVKTGRTESPIIPSGALHNCQYGLAQWNALTPAERAANQQIFDILRAECSVGLIPLPPPPA